MTIREKKWSSRIFRNFFTLTLILLLNAFTRFLSFFQLLLRFVLSKMVKNFVANSF